ncbi:MAG: hypothetical protein ACYDDE_00685 [bacterium]
METEQELFKTGLDIKNIVLELFKTEYDKNFKSQNFNLQEKLKLKSEIDRLRRKFIKDFYILYKEKYGEYPIALIGISESYFDYDDISKDAIALDFGQSEQEDYDCNSYSSINEAFTELHNLKHRGRSSEIIQQDVECIVNMFSR